MPRKPRFYLPDIPAHIVQRGNSRQAVFYRDIDYRLYLKWLVEGANRHGCQIHAYVLMTNHVHLLMTPGATDSISKTMQHVGRKYVMYVNARYDRSGTLWEGRHKGCPVATDRYFLACMRYIELNPVRAGIVSVPYEYRWSSYHQNASGQPGGFLAVHDCYLALGDDDKQRSNAYRSLFVTSETDKLLKEVRSTVQSGTPLGDDRFRLQIENALQKRVGKTCRGRPAKT